MSVKKVLFLGIIFVLILSSISFAISGDFTYEDYKLIYEKEISKEEQIKLNEKKSISKISIIHGLTNNIFYQSDSMNLIGLELKLTYTDGMTEKIDFTDSRLSFDEFDRDKLGLQNVYFYLERDNQRYCLGSILINVVKDTKETQANEKVQLRGTNDGKQKLYYAEITHMPNKSIYILGDHNIDFTGLKFFFHILGSNETTEEIEYDTQHFTFVDRNFDYNLVGQQDARLQWYFTEQYGDRYYSTAYGGSYEVIYVPIIIKENLDDKLITTAYIKEWPSKRVFDIDEEVTINDGIARVIYDDDSRGEIELNEETIKELQYEEGIEGKQELRIVLKEGSFLDIYIRIIDRSKELVHENPLGESVFLRVSSDNYRSEQIESIYSYKASDLPERFSLEQLFDIKVANQSSLGLCNLFAPTKSSETNIMMRLGQAKDFSERHADYMMSKKIGGDRTLGSLTNHVEGDAFGDDDTIHHATVIGYASEEEIPYRDYTDSELTTIKNANIIAKVNQYVSIGFGYYWDDYFDEIDEDELEIARERAMEMIKRHVMEYGSVTIAVNSGGFGYNWYNCTGAGHAISIIGWDDNYSKENFKDPRTGENPEGDGAWIVLNSWGESWGEKGKLYLSYYDWGGVTNGLGVLDAELLDDGLSYETHCDETFYSKSDYKNYYYKTFLYNEFEVDNNKKYLTSIVLPEINNESDALFRLYIVNDYDGTNINDYEYIGETNYFTCSQRIELKEPYELKGNSYVIIVEHEPNVNFHGFKESNIKTYYSYNTLKERSNWQKASLEFPMYLELKSQEELDEAKVERIEIIRMPNKTEYISQEEIDLTGGKIKVYYSDNTTGTINMTNPNVYYYGFSSSNHNTGDIPITIIYGGQQDSFDIFVNEVSSIRIKTMPPTEFWDNTSTHLGDRGVIELTYANGDTQDVSFMSDLITVYIDDVYKGLTTQWFYWSNYSHGEHTVTLKLLGQTISYEITVIPSAEQLVLISAPTRTTYYDGEYYDSSGMQVEVTFTDGSTKIVTSLEELIREADIFFYVNWEREYDGVLHTGDTFIATDFFDILDENGDALDPEGVFTFTVVAEPAINSIKMQTMPSKLSFEANEVSSLVNGGEIQIKYTDNTTRNKSMITGDISISLKKGTNDAIEVDEPNSFDFGTLVEKGEYTVLVRYKNYETSYTIQVKNSGIQGDIDCDGRITIMDIRLLLQAYVSSTSSTAWTKQQLAKMDLNRDGSITIVDIRLLLQMYINS